MTLIRKISAIDTIEASEEEKTRLKKELIEKYRKESNLVDSIVNKRTSLEAETNPIFERYKKGRTFIPFRNLPSENYVNLIKRLEGIVDTGYTAGCKVGGKFDVKLDKDLSCPTHFAITGALLGGILNLGYFLITGDFSPKLAGATTFLSTAMLSLTQSLPIMMYNYIFLDDLRKNIKYLDKEIGKCYKEKQLI